MNLTNNISINIYSIIILIIVYYQSIKHSEKDSFQYKLFIDMIAITFLMLIADIFSRFDGNSSKIYPILNHYGNFIMFLVSPILPSIWLRYVHYQIYNDELSNKKLIYPLAIINLINISMLIFTRYFGWYYYIDSLNIYHRGPLFLLGAAITIVLLIVAFILIITNRKKIEKRYYYALLFFPIPPLICLVLQINFYGISLMLNGVTLSILIVFLNIQNHSIYIDYLTGASNRKKLEMYIEDKISMVTEQKTFSAIMLDLNGFKAINDTYGHDMGDNALRTAAELLGSCIRSRDLIARFGGDEFFIVLDTSDIFDLETIVGRMKSTFERYNKSNEQPYKLSFGCGYAVYDYNSNMNVEEFEKHIDNLMYKNKQKQRIEDDIVV